MDDLSTIIQTFSKDEAKEFGRFIQRQRKKEKRMDLALFGILAKESNPSAEKVMHILYGESPNRVAYHRLRKRLKEELTNFILLKYSKRNHQPSSVLGLLTLALHVWEHRKEALTWKILHKAEKKALEREEYQSLHRVYLLQVEASQSEYAPVLDDILVRLERNQQFAQEEERFLIAKHVIQARLKAARLTGEILDVDDLVGDTLKKYGLTRALARRPRLLNEMATLLRAGALAKKEFISLEKTLIQRYQEMEKTVGFSALHLPYQVNLLYMIAHVSYRNKKFMASQDIIHRTLPLLEDLSRGIQHKNQQRFMALEAANLCYLGEAEAGIPMLERMLEDAPSPQRELDIRLTLCFFHFLRKEFRKALHISLDVTHTDSWLAKTMGKEWVLKKNMAILLLRYELGQIDLALNHIRKINRQHRDLFQLPVYKPVKQYLNLVSNLISRPEKMSEEAFFGKVETAFEFKPFEEENLQEMSFYAWLKARMLGRDYYEVLQEVVTFTD